MKKDKNRERRQKKKDMGFLIAKIYATISVLAIIALMVLGLLFFLGRGK